MNMSDYTEKYNSIIYMDNAATTRLSQEAMDAMMPYFRDFYGNASTQYSFADESKEAMRRAKAQTAILIGAKDSEIYFTSGGTEADNWALQIAARGYSGKGRHIITSRIEHAAMLRACERLEKEGFEITYLDVDQYGRIEPSILENAVRPDTILISVMAANNEIGTIQPLAQVGKIAKDRGILFHTDAVQAFGHIPLNVNELGIDMLSASAHKLNGPKGTGLLYVRRGVKISPMILGGGQERGMRAGTENIPGIVGFGAAAAQAKEHMDENLITVHGLRDHLIERVMTEIPFTRLNGHPENRLPGNASFSFKFIEAESLLVLLDMKGLCVSAGSACSSGSLEPSHVLTATGLDRELAMGTVRFSLDRENTMQQVDRAVEILKESVTFLRGKSTAYSSFMSGSGLI